MSCNHSLILSSIKNWGFLSLLFFGFVNFEVMTFLREKEIIEFFNFDFSLGLSPVAVNLPFTGVQISYVKFIL